MVSDELVEREREVMRQGTEALLAGISDRAIAKDWNNQGLRTVTGLEFQHQAIKLTLLRPKNAGLIEDDDGTLIGQLPGEPIIDVEKFERLRAKYPARNRGRRRVGSCARRWPTGSPRATRRSQSAKSCRTRCRNGWAVVR